MKQYLETCTASAYFVYGGVAKNLIHTGHLLNLKCWQNIYRTNYCLLTHNSKLEINRCN